MAKSKKKNVRPSAAPLRLPSLAPQVLEQAAQGWLQSSGAPPAPSRPARTASGQRLADALAATLQDLHAEIAELRARLDRLENR